MAKLTKGLVKISGKHGGEVFVNNGKHGSIVRTAPAKGIKKNEAALRLQYSRTRFLNGLASELNTILGHRFGNFKAAGFYQALQKCFRREPLDNRFLLLRQLKGMELNAAYPLGKLGACTITTKTLKGKVLVQLQTDAHPNEGRYGADCYCYELCFFTWNKSGGKVQGEGQLSEWIPIKGGRPGFEFCFPVRAGTLHWLLCLRLQLGTGKKELVYLATQGVQIAEAGSFDKGDMAILEKRRLEAGAPGTGWELQKKLPEVNRVQAKRYLQ